MASNWYRGGYQRRLNCSRHSQSHHGWFDTNLGWVGRPRENAEKEIRSVFLQPRALIAGPAAAMSNWRTIFVFGISWKKETVRKEAGVFQDPPTSKSLFIRTESWITFSFWSPVLFIYLCVVCSRVFCSPTAFLSFYWFFFPNQNFPSENVVPCYFTDQQFSWGQKVLTFVAFYFISLFSEINKKYKPNISQNYFNL